MGLLVVYILACIIGTAKAQNDPIPPNQIKSFEINLDLPPQQRWSVAVKALSAEIHVLLDILRAAFKDGEKDIDKLLNAYNSSLSTEYRKEMEGIGDSIGVSYHDTLMANMFYEVTGVINTPLDLDPTFARSCTSIVAQNQNGSVYLARNQDYPPPFTAVMVGILLSSSCSYVPRYDLILSFSRADSRRLHQGQQEGLRRDHICWNNWFVYRFRS
jgi:hypothetical protein